jgi:hypothetical protein
MEDFCMISKNPEVVIENYITIRLMIARSGNTLTKIRVQSQNQNFIDLRLELKCQMDPDIGGACRFCVLLDMRNKDIFDKPQEAYGKGCVSYVWDVNRLKPFARAVHHLPMTLNQEDLQFQMESNASVPRSTASYINLAQP